tara:strand:- start:202 stop:450 length:249 start_codon:yes stop_codon:yes gene_type:complete
MKSFLNYLVKYSLQAALITQAFWLVILIAIAWLMDLNFAWLYVKEIYPQVFLLLSVLAPVVFAAPVAALTAWQHSPARPFNR